jgi:deoxyribodipyrimidine photo-lyase
MMEISSRVPDLRCRCVNDAGVAPGGDYVLYWMTAFRRPVWNFSLQRAVEWASQLQRPLLVFEALRCDYSWASDRLHAFVLQGMRDQVRYFQNTSVAYYPYVEPHVGAGRGLLRSLAKQACVVVTDDFPCFFLPRQLAAAALRTTVRLEAVDSNGLLPLRAARQVYSRAFSFRAFLQKSLPAHLRSLPDPEPALRSLPTLARLPEEVERRWPALYCETDESLVKRLAELPIDHGVPMAAARGGRLAALDCLTKFLEQNLAQYAELRNHPDENVASGLSPYLHFGHLSVYEVFDRLMKQDGWTTAKLADRSRGAREGWWGASATVESFLDELVTWRELGYNTCWQQANYDQYESLPEWAQLTLKKHRKDRRAFVYSLEEFEQAETHDPLWNAAQRQLLQEGRIHNYLRMLWGKKILEWTQRPEDALQIMIQLNNRWALDGRNPNSYSGIFWTLGRYDRAWGPEREIFGTVRFMSSENTARKVRLRNYLQRFGSHPKPTTAQRQQLRLEI